MASVSKRTVMTLYSDNQGIDCHRVRIVIAEKALSPEIYSVNPAHLPESLLELNPYGTLPTLVDRDLVIYNASIIMEYLDERFPHPPLLPVYPVARAQQRQIIFRIERDWYSLYHQILAGQDVEVAKRNLLDSLVGLEPVFADRPYFLSEEFSLIDCTIAPLLWRLPSLGIEIPNSARQLKAYMQRLFSRPSFKASLSDVERELCAA